MKKTILLFALVATTLVSFGQTKPPVKKPVSTAKPVVSKFGALAIDRNNGFYYGWSFDYTTLAEAEKKAIEECNAKGGNCTVVLSYSGTGCAAYKTIDGSVGTAYGWGLAKTKEEADAIATKECLKRSNGTNPTNFVWSCNSANSGLFKEIYNAISEIIPVIKIGNQNWTTFDFDITKFKNGDAIPYASTKEEWNSYLTQNKPAYIIINSKYIYNGYAINDERGLAPDGFHIPSDNDWAQLINYLGGENIAGSKLKSKTGWFENNNSTNSSGFSALPGTSSYITLNLTADKIIYEGGWWSSTKAKSGRNWVRILHYSREDVYRTDHGNNWGYSIRLIKD